MLVSNTSLLDQRTIVLTPTGKDSHLIVNLLERSALFGYPVGSVRSLCVEVAKGAGASIISEEALTGDAVAEILNLLREQPSWSDFPLLLLTVGVVSR